MNVVWCSAVQCGAVRCVAVWRDGWGTLVRVCGVIGVGWAGHLFIYCLYFTLIIVAFHGIMMLDQLILISGSSKF